LQGNFFFDDNRIGSGFYGNIDCIADNLFHENGVMRIETCTECRDAKG
jgi:hypothetical protein